MRMITIDVSIIIVNYNTTSLVVNAIDSLFQKTRDITFEIIVVDNASNDDPEKRLLEEFCEVSIIKLKENIGFGRANNEGLKKARGRNILFLNSDTLLLTNSVKILSDYLDTHPKVGACGGNLYNVNGKPIYSYHRLIPGIFSEELAVLTMGISNRFIYQPFFNYTSHPIAVGNVSGANMMVSRKVLDEVGIFDPDFFMYSEETELSWRIKRKGYKIMNVPQSKIVHLEGKSFKVPETRMRMMLESRAKYYIKTRGLTYLRVANILLWLGVGINIIGWKILKRREREVFYKTKWKLINKMYSPFWRL